MNQASNTKCICTTQGYAPDCPQAFMQNGTLMHTLSRENQLKPRYYEDPSPLTLKDPGVNRQSEHQPSRESSKGNQEANPLEISNDQDDGPISDEDILTIQRKYTGSSEMVRDKRLSPQVKNWATDTDMQNVNRREPPNFDSLSYNGTTLTDATIGGFRLNLQTAQSKALAFIPLPPVCLPIIFMDKDLNFFHHFFQGLDILLGKKYMEKIVSQDKYSDSDSRRILPSLKALIMSGAKETDTELTMFVKRVLSGTFDTLPEASVSPEMDELIVAVNMWGFQYLEPSMRCRDSDLRMWLHMSFMKYQVSWFNTFKSSGVPKFALHGVQDRYESKGDDQWKMCNVERELKSNPRAFRFDNQTTRRVKSYKDERSLSRYDFIDGNKKNGVLGKFFS